jgi:F0F1-type ATP synthase assembly protein I
MKQKKTAMALVGEYTALAFLLPSCTVVGYGMGYLLDKAFGTHFLYLVFLVFGIIAGFLELVRKVMKDTQEDGS